MRNTFAESLLVAAKSDPSIMLITGDLGYGVLKQFEDELPNQFMNAGIAEQSMMSLAAGLASKGFKPFVYSIANFSTFRCLEQIRNDVSYMENAVSIVSVGSGLGYGVHGYSHHAVEDISVMRVFGNINIYSPGDPSEVIASVRHSLDSKKPSYFRIGKGGEPNFPCPQANALTPRVVSHGKDGAILFTGAIGSRVLNAKTDLVKMGFDPEIVSIPLLDESVVSSFLRNSAYDCILTIEEHVLPGGFGSFILELISDARLNIPFTRMGVTQYVRKLGGSSQFLLDNSDLRAENIASSFVELASSR